MVSARSPMALQTHRIAPMSALEQFKHWRNIMLESSDKKRIAQLIGVTPGTINDWMNGSIPNILARIRLMDVARIPVESWPKQIHRTVPKRRVDFSGVRVGKLTGIVCLGLDQYRKRTQWLCKCDCGTEVIRTSNTLAQAIKRHDNSSCNTCRKRG